MSAMQTKRSRKAGKKRGRKDLSLEEKDRRKQVGGNLAKALKKLGLSDAEAARRAGIAQGTLTHIKNGDRLSTLEHLGKLGEKLNISSDYLLGIPDAPMFVAEPFTRGLEKAIAARVGREVKTSYEKLGGAYPYLGFEPPKVDASRILSEAVKECVTDYLAWGDRITTIYQARAPLVDMFLLIGELQTRARDKTPLLQRRWDRRTAFAERQLTRLFKIVHAEASTAPSRFLVFPAEQNEAEP